MEKLTKKQAIEEHRKMWRWIAEETEKRKRVVRKGEYLDLYYPNADIECDCFCCEYGTQKMIKKPCAKCPINWDSECDKYMCFDKTNFEDDNLYALWTEAGDTENWKKAAEVARQIAELPESEEE